MTGIVCYLERDPVVGDLRRVRLVGPELDRTWTSPAAGAALGGADAGASTSLAPSPVQTLRSAAAWVADELGKYRELAAVCVDVSGGVCGWLSAPSSAPAVVLAALQQHSTTSQPSGSAFGPESTTPAPSFGLLGDAPLGPGTDRSIEALAPFEAPAQSGLTSLTRKATGDTLAAAQKRRLAVLSIPDAAVRVFLDELDRLRIEVEAVLSLWHATAAAWDAGRPGRGSSADASSNGRSSASSIADAAPPVTATVLIEPNGRLLWSWSMAGDLLAAGSMRLRVNHRAPGPAADATAGSESRVYSPPAPDESIAPLPGYEPLTASESPSTTATQAARRVTSPSTAVMSEEHAVVDCSRAQIGRLVMDWLGWSAQLGVTPDRIVCLGVETASESTTGEPSTLASSLAEAWPGATVDVVSHHDPIGATLSRLRTLPDLGRSHVPATTSSEAGAAPVKFAADNPQAGLLSLSHRAGRNDRTLYRWIALGVGLLALAVFFGAYRLDRATRGAADKLAELKAERVELLKSVEDVAPGISTRASSALDELQGKLIQARDEKTKLRREPALLPEIVRVMQALNTDPSYEKLQITQFELSSLVPGTLSMWVPYNDTADRDIPVFFWQELVKLPGVIEWSSGDWEPRPPTDGRRKYVFEARWPLPAPTPPPGTVPGGKP